MSNVCVIDDDPGVRDTILSLVRRMGLSGVAAATLAEGREALSREPFDVLFLDVRLPDGNGLQALPDIKRRPDAPEVIILTGLGDPDGAELAIQEGVWDYLVKPSPAKQIMLSLERALRYHEEKRCDRPPVSLDLSGCVTISARMKPCLDQAAQAAASAASVLLTGETGTGKELFARLIHANSARAKGPFVAVDCASLTETLVESTLFGHKKGAFTGADADRVGLVLLADKGTLFLDEVGEMSLALQKTFLRVLNEKRFRPVGAVQESTSDFRLIAATNRDLDVMIEQGRFRRDLYFRLKTIALALPPLRRRPEDIKPLALHFVDRLCRQYQQPSKGFDAEFLNMLEAHSWPGNVRELQNVLERAVVAAGPEKTLCRMHLPQDVRIKVTKTLLERQSRMADGVADTPGIVEAADEPGAGDAPSALPAPAPAPSGVAAASPGAGRTAACPAAEATAISPPAPPEPAGATEPVPSPTSRTLKAYKEAMERRYLVALLGEHGRDLTAMLDVSGLSRSHFYSLLKKYDLTLPD